MDDATRAGHAAPIIQIAEISPPKRVVGRPFPKGIAPNPGGRPKGYAEARAACRALNDETLQVLLTMMRDPDTHDQVRLLCATRIRDEAWGKPAQAVVIAAEEHNELRNATDEQLLAVALEMAQQMKIIEGKQS